MSLRSQHDPYNADSDDEDEDYVPPNENKSKVPSFCHIPPCCSLETNLKPSWFFVDDSDSEPSDDEGSANGVGETDLQPTGVDQEEEKRWVLDYLNAFSRSYSVFVWF
jgi:hypothetical protein